MGHIIDYLEASGERGEALAAMKEYRAQYGV